VRGVRWQIYQLDIIDFAFVHEIRRDVAAVAIKKKNSRLKRVIWRAFGHEYLLQLMHTDIIRCLAVLRGYKDPILLEILVKPACLDALPFENNRRTKEFTYSANNFNNSDLFARFRALND
jgi:hypothetical protein